MIPKDHMLYGEEGMLYRDYTNRLAREGVHSSEIPSFSEWQAGEAGKFKENIREDPESGRRYGIMFVGIGLAAYLAFQAYSCLGDRNPDKGYSPIERRRENSNMKQDPDLLPMDYRKHESKKVEEFIDTYINPPRDQLNVNDLNDPLPNPLDQFESEHNIRLDELLELKPDGDKNTREK